MIRQGCLGRRLSWTTNIFSVSPADSSHPARLRRCSSLVSLATVGTTHVSGCSALRQFVRRRDGVSAKNRRRLSSIPLSDHHLLQHVQVNSSLGSFSNDGLVLMQGSRPDRRKTGATPTENSHPDPVTVDDFLLRLEKAAAWNHGRVDGKRHDKSLWDTDMCRQVADTYNQILKALSSSVTERHQDEVTTHQYNYSAADRKRLLSPTTVTLALKVLVKCHYEPDVLSRKVRDWERCVGLLKMTPLTDHLSLRMITANGKAGNVGRVLSLLQLRKAHTYGPRHREFEHAVTSLQAAASDMRRCRNIFVSEDEQPAIDDPTRWLDAILINMHQRGYPLTLDLANHMLRCYARTGKSGKAVHHFYRIVRQPIDDLPMEDRPEDASGMPVAWCYVPEQLWELNKSSADSQRDAAVTSTNNVLDATTGRHAHQAVKVKLQYHPTAPPFYKVPAQVQGTNEPAVNTSHGAAKRYPVGNGDRFLKLNRELDPEYSPQLAAAFSFADSLQLGACGHAPIQLNTASYNALIQACVNRGALWRAMHVLDDLMTTSTGEKIGSSSKKKTLNSTANDYVEDYSDVAATTITQPNVVSYNLILAGLSMVGDVSTAQDYYMKMISANIEPDAFTVRAVVDGLLNLGDMAGAVTVVQDFFNQHSVLPPYTTHLKVLEFCLASDLVYEAKRYVYFIQQLWHWTPNQYHNERIIKLVYAAQKNTQLQKPALQKLFAYFGEELTDKDFL